MRVILFFLTKLKKKRLTEKEEKKLNLIVRLSRHTNENDSHRFCF
tara:strand:+ start:219 stop:353 length:135 start_codon:yes stop_codon:yes gene_type:complete